MLCCAFTRNEQDCRNQIFICMETKGEKMSGLELLTTVTLYSICAVVGVPLVTPRQTAESRGCQVVPNSG